MKRITIAFMAPNLGVGGAERQWHVLLPRLREHGIDPIVVTIDGRGHFFELLRDAGIPTMCAEWAGKLDARRALALAHRLPKTPDLIVTRGLSAQFVGAVTARRLRVPHVVTEHTDYVQLPPRTDRRLPLQALAPRARWVIAVSDSQIPGLIRHGYRADRITVIPNGVPAATSREGEDRAEYMRSAEAVRVALVAALRPEKRVGDFIRAIQIARQSGAQVEGLVAGGGDALPHYRNLARRAGSSTRFLGAIEDVDALLASADVACLTSEHEAMSMALLEALSHSLPLVATNVGASPQLCVHGLNGFITEVGDIEGISEALLRLSTDPVLRRDMAQASKQLFQNSFSADRMAQRYATFMASVLHDRHS